MSDFEDDKKLGSGGFGEVWRVIRTNDGEAFAKKTLADSDPEAVKRFQREVRIISKLDHPRIIRIVATKLDEEPPWYVMPLYDHSLWEEFPGIVNDERRIAKIVSAILEGIQYAHEQGVIHRDLKPENILMNSDEDLVISNFGLGRALDAKTSRATHTGARLGTPGYLPPEQVTSAKSTDQRGDIFTLGRMIYKLYSGDSMLAVQNTRKLTVAVAMIIDKCTQTDPADRYQSVEELRIAFASVVAAKSEASVEEKMRGLIAKAVTDDALGAEDAVELTGLITKAHGETDLLHDLCMQLPASAIGAIWQADPDVTRLLVRVFTDHATPQNWGFDYTDRIGGACVKLHSVIPDGESRGLLIAALIEIGVGHNRWHVMGLAASLLQTTQNPQEAIAVAHALKGLGERVRNIQGYLDVAVSKLAPPIRDFFADSE